MRASALQRNGSEASARKRLSAGIDEVSASAHFRSAAGRFDLPLSPRAARFRGACRLLWGSDSLLLSLTLPGREQGRLARSSAASTRQLPTRSSLRTMTAAPYTLEEFAQADLHDVLDRLSLQEKVSLLAGPDW